MSAISVSSHNVAGAKVVFNQFDNFSSIELKFITDDGTELLEVTLFVEDAVAVGKVLQQLSTATNRK